MRPHRQKGMSLIEVLMAIAIFGIMLGGIFNTLNRGNSILSTAAELLQARLLVNKTMETLKVSPFEELHNHSFTEMTPQGRMTVEVQISEFQTPTLRKIDVAVHWQDHRKQSKQLTLSTLRSQYSLGG